MINAGMCSDLNSGMMMVDCWLSQFGDDLVGALITRGRDIDYIVERACARSTIYIYIY